MNNEELSLDKLFRPEALSFPKYSLNEPSALTRLHQNEVLLLEESDRMELVEEMRRRIKSSEAFNTYPTLEPVELLNAFANSLNVPIENIEVTAGSSQALTLIAEALFGPARTAAITAPSFSLYAHLAALYGSPVVPVTLDERFEYKPEALFSDQVLNAHVAILCTPNNPTGTALSFETVVEFASQFKGVLVIDEAYFEFLEAQGGQSCVQWATGRKNVIVLRTLSKAWGAAGLRVGAMIAHRDVINIFRALKAPYSIAWPSEVLASYILSKKQNATRERVGKTVQQVAALEECLSGCRGIDFLARSRANFVFLKSARAGTLEKALTAEGFLIRRYSAGRLENCVRISMPPPCRFEKLKSELRKVLS
jgi:histidinol-phosphate aminotransferase